MATSIFKSQSPGLVRTVGGLLSFKAVVACAGGSYFASRVFAPVPGSPPTPIDFTDLPAVASVLSSSPDARLAAACFGLGALSQWFSHRIMSRVVVSIDRHPAPADDVDPDDDVLHIHRLAVLGGTATHECRRSHVLPALPGSRMANFVLKSESGWEKTMYLLPSDDWSSDDKPYLRRLVYEAYFRDEPPPPPDADLMAIEGFGPFRPAVFADPTSPHAQTLADRTSSGTSSDILPSTCYQKDGEVYAEFVVPKKPSLAEKRRRATAKALGKDDNDGDEARVAALPPLPNSTTPASTPTFPNDTDADADADTDTDADVDASKTTKQ